VKISKPNSNVIFLIFLFSLFYVVKVHSDSIEKLNAKIDSLDLRLIDTDKQIKDLESKKTQIIDQIAKVKQEIYNYELDQDFSDGIITIVNLDAILQDKPTREGNQIIEVSAGDTILVYNEYKKPYFKVSYKNKIGFLSYISIKLDDRLKEIVIPNYSIKNKNKKKKLDRLAKKFGKSIASRIIQGKYWLGMTKEMARNSLGSPNDINKSTGSWGNHEQWIYEKRELYLYFENGKLTSFQN